MMLRYKVLRKDGDLYLSFFVAGKAQVRYEQGVAARPPRWLKEKGFGLCVFSTLEQARAYAWQLIAPLALPPPTEIWECECDEPANPHTYCHPFCLETGDVLAFANNTWPAGTEFFMAVTPLRRVGEDALDILVKERWE